ncbi:MAG: hypothetical protein JNG88_03100 [Phycisphaerales bacterium]|nr:hypothetical protein [Phycisphaerales bacterium]
MMKRFSRSLGFSHRAVVCGLLGAASIARAAGPELNDADLAAQKAGFSALTTGPAHPYDIITSTGYFRSFQTLQAALPEGGIAAEDMDKTLVIDAQTGALVVSHLVDQLPAGWRLSAHDGLDADSLGRPIVNRATGLPAWSQVDVDALRAEIQARAASVTGSPESDRTVGNLIAQAFIRRIDISDLSIVDNPAVMTDMVIQSALSTVERYEATKLQFAAEFGGAVAMPAYRPEAVALFAAAGFDPAGVTPVGGETEEGGTADSNCYATNTSPRGILTITGSTTLWLQDGTDDATADVPLGFDFRAFACEERGANDNVRVSTNGLLSFFERGGAAATNVHAWTNTFLPDAAAPNGIVAGWWDDLQVEPAQGSPDHIHYKTEGAPPFRVFTAEWSSMSRRGGLATDYHWFQIKLYELTGRIEIVIDADFPDAGDSADNASVGIENFDATDSDCGPNCTNTVTWDHPYLALHRYLTRLISNDTCAYAIPVVANQSVSADLITAWHSENGPVCWMSEHNRDVWYTFTAPSRGVLRLNACGTMAAGGSDAVLAIYDDCPTTGGQLIACNDDRSEWADAPNGDCSILDSYVAAVMNPNEQVMIRASHFGSWLFGAFVEFDVRFLPSIPGDMNCDGRVNNFDIDPFVQALSDQDGWLAEHPSCDLMNGDINGDGEVNNFDIDPFVACLTVGC